MDSDVREITISAIERFKELLGVYPNIHVNHESNKENLYWGKERLNLLALRFIMMLLKKSSESFGHISGSPLLRVCVWKVLTN